MRKLIFLLCFTTLFGKSAVAQVLHESKLSFIRYQALLKVDEYARNCGLEDITEVDKFKGVLHGAMINNDVLPDNNLNSQITIDQYSDLLIKYKKSIFTEVRAYSAIVEEGVSHDGGRDIGVVFVSAFKEIEFVSKNDNRYNDTLNIRFTIAYNMTDTSFFITKVETNKWYGKYVFIGITNKKSGKKKLYKSDLQKVLVNTDTVELSNKGEVFRKNLVGSQYIKIEPISQEYFQIKTLAISSDEIGADDEARSNYLTVHFRKKRFYLRPSVSVLTNINSLAINGDKDYSTAISTLGTNYGLDVGLNLFPFKSIPLNLNFIVGGKQTTIGYLVKAPLFEETYQDIDSDGDSYIRKTTITDINEVGEISFFQIPLTLRFDYTVNKLWGAFGGVGYSYAFQRNLSYASTATGNYQGTYGPEYFNIILKEKGVYDFGQFNIGGQGEITDTQPMGMLKFDLGTTLQINKRLSGEFSLSSWFGLNPLSVGTDRLSGNFSELNSTYQKAIDNSLRMLNFEIGLKYYL